MANRSYLYSLSNRPASYADRPETICGLSEWPYAVPFSYRLLMSGDPQGVADAVIVARATMRSSPIQAPPPSDAWHSRCCNGS